MVVQLNDKGTCFHLSPGEGKTLPVSSLLSFSGSKRVLRNNDQDPWFLLPKTFLAKMQLVGSNIVQFLGQDSRQAASLIFISSSAHPVNTAHDHKITLKRVMDFVKDKGDENAKEINKKLQHMLEETLTKNMHLQKVGSQKLSTFWNFWVNLSHSVQQCWEGRAFSRIWSPNSNWLTYGSCLSLSLNLEPIGNSQLLSVLVQIQLWFVTFVCQHSYLELQSRKLRHLKGRHSVTSCHCHQITCFRLCPLLSFAVTSKIRWSTKISSILGCLRDLFLVLSFVWNRSLG